MMVQLGVLPDVVEKCLNHTEPNKLKRIDQRASYEGSMVTWPVCWPSRS